MAYFREVKRKKKSYGIFIGIITVLLIPLSFLLYVKISYADKIYSGVYVGQISIGGLTKQEAAALLSKEYENLVKNSDMNVVYGNKSHSLNIKENAKPDFDSTAQEAFDTGRKGAFFKNFAVSLGNKSSLPVKAQYDTENIKNMISDFANAIEQEQNIITFVEEQSKVRVDLLKGVIADVDSTLKAVTDSFSSLQINDIKLITKSIEDSGESIVELLYEKLNRKPSDATFKVIDNEVIVNEGKKGARVSKEAIREKISAGKKTFEMDVEIIEPNVSKDYLESIIFKDVLGSYSTRFSLSNPGRANNIKLAAQSINNTVIAPGEDFSFNKVVGQRTYANGYADANVYIGGKIEQGVGGGICQVSSTLYSAQLLADLETVKRHNHMFTVSYLPLGQDATVAWNSVDYVFKNSTEYPIKIKATVSNDVHHIQILGTKMDSGRMVKIVNQTISTTPARERVEYSNKLKPGEVVVVQSGQNGAVVDTYKVYYNNGVEEKRQFLHRSVYNVMDRIIQRGPVNTSLEEEDAIEEEEAGIEDFNPEDVPASQAPTPSKEPKETPKTTPEDEPVAQEYLSEYGI